MRKVGFRTDEKLWDNPTIAYRDKSGMHTVSLEAGGLWSIDVEVFRENEYTYVLSWNEQHPYIGIERFLGNIPKGNLFLSMKDSIEQLLGENALKLAPMTLVKRLAHYLVDAKEKRKGR